MAWFKKTDRGEGAAEWSRALTINAGGILYTTARGSLRHLSSHAIFGPILASTASRSGDDSSVFLDCDGTLFRFVLNFLRAGGGGGGEQQQPTQEDGSTTTTSGAQLCLPDGFDEWEQLLTEARLLQLPSLAAAVGARYEYQRTMFLRTLPLGVCVRWPTTVIVREGGAVGPPPQRPGPGTATAVAAAGGGEGSSGVLLAEQVARSALRVSITPSLPSLVVAEDGRTVLYGGPEGEKEVVPDLERLVALLVTAYGYSIQHWHEREGRVFLGLPGAK